MVTGRYGHQIHPVSASEHTSSHSDKDKCNIHAIEMSDFIEFIHKTSLAINTTLSELTYNAYC